MMKAQDRFQLFQKILLLLLAGFSLLSLSGKVIMALSFTPDLGGFERNVIWGIQQIMSGNSLYSNPEKPPFAMIQYMPLYYYAMASLAVCSGISPDDAHGVYQLARMFNLFIGILLPFLVFFLLRKKFSVALVPALCVALLSYLVAGGGFSISGRPDALKAFFFLLQLVMLVQFSEIRLRWLFPLSLLLSLLCFSCKQDGLTAFGILPLAFLLGREWRNLFGFSILAGLTLAIFLPLMQWSFGGNFFANVFGALQNGISFSWFKSVFFGFFAQHSILFALAMVLSFEFSSEKNRAFRLLSAGFIIAFFPPLLAALKFGSGPNYFFEALLVSCLLCGVAMKVKDPFPFFRFRESTMLFFLAMACLWFTVPAMEWTSSIFLNQERQREEAYKSELQNASLLKKAFPERRFMLLTGRQWEDHLSTLLQDRIINPNRDVSEQVFTGRGGNALHSLRAFIRQDSGIALITETEVHPAFPGMDFSGFRKDRVIGKYQVWVK